MVASAHVLLVDDNRVNLEIAEDLLRRCGLRVETALHGAEAVERASKRHFDLILMDLHMPVLDGLEAARRIRAQHGPGLPIIALTADGTQQARAACRLAGMNEHLAKPIDIERLHGALQRWLPAGTLAAWPLSAVPEAAQDSSQGASVEARLTAIEGFELSGSLQNLNGQLPRLLRVLRRFADTYRDGEPRLTAAALTMDAKAGWQVCHSLRGACATLCATRLVERLEAYELALTKMDAPALQAQAAHLQTELVALARSLDAGLRA